MSDTHVKQSLVQYGEAIFNAAISDGKSVDQAAQAGYDAIRYAAHLATSRALLAVQQLALQAEIKEFDETHGTLNNG